MSFGRSNRKSCSLIGLWRSTQAYKVKDPYKDEAIIKRMRALVQEYPKWGCPMVHDVLKREGLVVNAKRTERIYYREERLSLRQRKRRRQTPHTKITSSETGRPNERGAMDFVHDSLWNGRKLRTLTMIDIFTKESLKIEVATSISGERVVRALN